MKTTKPPSRRRGITKVEVAVLLGVSLSVAALLVPVFARARANARRASCQSNLKSISIRMRAYMDDYDQKFPSVNGNGVPTSVSYGWAGAMYGYIGSVQMLQCPSEPNPPEPQFNRPGFSDYWMDANLSGARMDRLTWYNNTFLFGDGTGGTAAYALSAPEPGPNYRWMNRHLNGANYSFVDGHVKWLLPSAPRTIAASPTVFTFGT